MKTLKIILFIVIGAVGILLVISLVSPKSYTVERSVTIDAPANIVREQIQYFDNFLKWEPWGKYDPNAEVTISDPDGQIGSTYAWSGNEDVGSGSMEILSISPERIEMSLLFTSPYESQSLSFYEISDDGESTELTWGFEGEMGVPMNLMLVFMDMDAMLGADFESGLSSLKALCEEIADRTINGFTIMEKEFGPRTYIGSRKQVSMEDFATFYAEGIQNVMTKVQQNDITITGSPSGLYFSWDMETGTTDMAPAIPVSSGSIAGLQTLDISGSALHVVYYGDYENLMAAHEALGAYMEQNEITDFEVAIEEYVTDPGQEPDTSKWLTNIYYVLN